MYIEREALKERFQKRVEWLAKDEHDVYSKGLLHGCETDAELIDEIPAADVEPVVHGEVEVLPTKERVEVDCVCKACGTRMRTDDNYCPNCGAKMDGGINNAE